MNRGNTLVKLAALAGVLGMLAACSGNADSTMPNSSAGSSQDNQQKQDVILSLPGGSGSQFAENFNPFSSSVLLGLQGSVYETLFFNNRAAESELVPLLGTSFEYSEDGRVLTVQLREGVKWSDGEPFTADDVAFTLNLIAKTPEINTGGFKGAAEATSDTEVVVTFEEADTMNTIGTITQTYIVPEHIWSDVADVATNINSEPVGTGPFVLESFTAQNYLFKKNENYWDAGKPEISGVRYVALAGNQSAVDSLIAGEIDWASTFIPNIDQILGSEADISYTNTVQNQLSLVTCSNVELGCKGPQTDPAVRKAIYYAMDRDQLNNLAFSNINGDVSPTFALLPRDEQWVASSSDEKVASNTSNGQKAEQILQDAGYAKGTDGIYAKDGERLSFDVLTVSGWTDWIAGIDTMSQQLAPLGIELRSSQVSWNEWNDAAGSGNFKILINNLWPGSGNEPFYLYQTFFSSESTAPVGETANPNWSRFSNAEVDKALATLKTLTDKDAKLEQYRIIQDIIVEEMPYIPIQTYGSLTQFRTDRVENWPIEDNVYALPMMWQAPDYAEVLRNLKVK